MRNQVGRVLIGALTSVLLLSLSARSEAAFVAYICDDPACVGGGDVIVTDGGAGDAASGVPGEIIMVGANVGGFASVSNDSSTKPLLAQPQMTLKFSLTAGAGASVGTPAHAWLYATNTGYNVVSPLSFVLDGSSTGSGSISGSVYGGVDNTQGTLANPATTGPIGFPPGVFNASVNHAAAVVNPYSLTIGVEIVQTVAGGVTTGTFSNAPAAAAVPEPASLLLLGTGLIGAAARRRRRSSPKL